MSNYSRTLTVAAVSAVMVAASTGAGYAGGDRHKHRHHGDKVSTVAELSGPRGVDSIGRGLTLVTEDDGSFSLVIERSHSRRGHHHKGRRGHKGHHSFRGYTSHHKTKVIELGSIPASAGFANAIAGTRSKVYILTGAGAPDSGAASLYVWDWRRKGDPKLVADIGAYQAEDLDPYDLEDAPEESNPFGLAPLRDGSVLVADAAGNDLLRVYRSGRIKTVARLMPRTVEVPEGLPPTDPEGNPLPPAGTEIPAEAVATSVTVGDDGYWYVGELRGFPATPGTSQIWRIKPGSVNAVCDPAKATKSHHRHHKSRHSACKRYADGLTSIVDLAADDDGNIYAVTLSKLSWLAMELGVDGSEVGGLFKVRHHGHSIREVAKDKLMMPGGADVSDRGDVYVTGPVFGPGALVRIGSR